jgi:hypothetical protein
MSLFTLINLRSGCIVWTQCSTFVKASILQFLTWTRNYLSALNKALKKLNYRTQNMFFLSVTF